MTVAKETKKATQAANPPDAINCSYGNDDIVVTPRTLAQGKALGPFVDATNGIRAAGLIWDGANDEHPRSEAISHLLWHITNGGIPEWLYLSFSSTHHLTLHKNIDDLTKLCLIEAGCALCRIAVAHLCCLYQCDFVKHLLPYNSAIGIKGGRHLWSMAYRCRSTDESTLKTLPSMTLHCQTSCRLCFFFHGPWFCTVSRTCPML